LFDPLAQLFLVVLYGEEVVSSPVLNDVPGAFSLGVERVGGDNGSVEFYGCEQFGQGWDFIAFVINGHLVLNDSFVVRERSEKVEFVIMGLIRAGAAHGLSINGDSFGAFALQLT